jgi:hypothetical protein
LDDDTRAELPILVEAPDVLVLVVGTVRSKPNMISRTSIAVPLLFNSSVNGPEVLPS